MSALIMKLLGVDKLAARIIEGLLIVALCAGSFVAGCSTGKDLERAEQLEDLQEATEEVRRREGIANDWAVAASRAAEAAIAAQRGEVDDATDHIADGPTSARQRARACLELQRQARRAGTPAPDC